MEEHYARGYVKLTSGNGGNYVFQGELGSLDHILINETAAELVTGVGVRPINAFEVPALEYSRANHNAVDLYRSSSYRSSDHDPLFVGLELGVAPALEPEPPVEPTEESAEMSPRAGYLRVAIVSGFLLAIVGALIGVVISRCRGSQGAPGSR